MLKEFIHLSEKLNDPEYLHLLLEPVMIYGLAIGVIVFLFSFFFSERRMQFVALGIIIVSSLAVIPYLDQREKADKQVVKLRASNLPGMESMMKESQERRKDSQKAYVIVAALAGLTLLMGAHKGKPGMFAGVATSIAGAAVVVHGAWLHLEDAEIYHPNIRVVESVDGEKAEEKALRREKKRSEQARIEEGRASTQPVLTAPRHGDRRVSTSKPR